MSIDIFIMGDYGENLFVSGCIKNVDRHHESFSEKKTNNKIVIAKNL